MRKTGYAEKRLLARLAVLVAAAGVLIVSPAGTVQAARWKPLTDTGQNKCYDMGGAEIACPDAGPLSGQDARYVGREAAFQDQGDQTVLDTNTGLIWMQSDDGTGRAWPDAGAYCEALVFAGQSDWRLPQKFELESIVDYGRSYPAMNPVFSCRPSFYWSALPYTDDPTYAWGVMGKDGGDHWLDKRNTYYVRCVRGGL